MKEMFADRLETDFHCSDCNKNFATASSLLRHFALHVSEISCTQNNSTDDNGTNKSIATLAFKKKRVPDLYPIGLVNKCTRKSYETNSANEALHSSNSGVYQYMFQDGINECNIPNSDKEMCHSNNSSNESIPIEVDDDFNPLKFCSISMDEETQEEPCRSTIKRKKYSCPFCSKLFGWSTDLKRHILIHTGERPFKCKLCSASFTRNFLLQKHENKVHHPSNTKGRSGLVRKMKMPKLKPIFNKMRLINVRRTSEDGRLIAGNLYKNNLHEVILSAGATVQ